MPPYRHSEKGWLTGNSLAPETGRVLIIPGDLAFVMAVNGALLELTQEWNWQQFGTVTPEEAADAMRIMYFDWIESELPVTYNFPQIDLWVRLATYTGGSWLFQGTANANFGHYITSPTSVPSSSGYTCRNTVKLAAGDYFYQGTYVTTTSSGIIDVNLTRSGGSVVVATIVNNLDLYAGFNQAVVSATFTVVNDGEYEIQVRSDSVKNPSSAGYAVTWTGHHIRRTL